MGVYMRTNNDVWSHVPPADSSWYQRKLHKLKRDMQAWYVNGRYARTTNGKYSVSAIYRALQGEHPI